MRNDQNISMAHPLEGIAERLKRAKENIDNLEIEISRFLDEKGHREVVERDHVAIKKFNEFWSNQSILPRFPVLISEILHHYRASLDNLIWELLRQVGHSPSTPSAIEFPIFSTRPTSPGKLTMFNRKIEGVGNQASALIESLQPYNAVSKWEGPNHALLVLHDMNRFDKHRELTVVASRPQQTPQIYLQQLVRVRKNPATGESIKTPIAHREVYVGMKLTALVAFRQFGDNGPNIGVIPGLRRIETAVYETTKLFDVFFPAR